MHFSLNFITPDFYTVHLNMKYLASQLIYSPL